LRRNCNQCKKNYEYFGWASQYCPDCKKIRAIEQRRKYDRKRAKTKHRREQYKKWYKSPGSLKWRKKKLIRQQTRDKYGKPLQGYEYHHIEPYNPDVWVLVPKDEHSLWDN